MFCYIIRVIVIPINCLDVVCKFIRKPTYEQSKLDLSLQYESSVLTSLKGFVMTASSCQLDVRQMRRVLSSDWEERYLPTGSQVTPFTSPVCPFSTAITSVTRISSRIQ